ncbi:GTPase IMAP family member 2-like [Crotalus adamanteus]|uniref:GTPase IMAP family member 2-like n=1 Tax=Crotalus adamanteus TaxID=8729 RepID=A0AAW1B320_CROAD
MKISVVDTPGIFDSDNYTEIVGREIMACIQLSWPGPHALILVTQVGRFSAEDAAAAKYVRDIFGPKSARHTIVLFTCLEDLGGDPLEEYVQKSDNRNLQDLIWQCRNRYCGFNNKATGAERERQVAELMETVQRVVFENGGRYYVNQLYLEPNLHDEHVKRFVEQNRNARQRFSHPIFLPFWKKREVGKRRKGERRERGGEEEEGSREEKKGRKKGRGGEEEGGSREEKKGRKKGREEERKKREVGKRRKGERREEERKKREVGKRRKGERREERRRGRRGKEKEGKREEEEGSREEKKGRKKGREEERKKGEVGKRRKGERRKGGEEEEGSREEKKRRKKGGEEEEGSREEKKGRRGGEEEGGSSAAAGRLSLSAAIQRRPLSRGGRGREGEGRGRASS